MVKTKCEEIAAWLRQVVCEKTRCKMARRLWLPLSQSYVA